MWVAADFVLVATTSATGYVDGSVAAAASYRFRVRARDAAGNRGGYSNLVTVTTPAAPDVEPPSAPGVLVGSARASDRVDLSWGAASDNVGVTGYELERCLGVGCSDFVLVATTSATGYVDGSVAAAASYRFRVRARDAAGNRGGYSNLVTVTTQAAPDVEPPSAPGVLVGSAPASDRVDLSWGAASDNVGVTGYELERCSGVGCSDLRWWRRRRLRVMSMVVAALRVIGPGCVRGMRRGIVVGIRTGDGDRRLGGC